MIRRMKNGWAVFSHKTGKRLSRAYKSKKQAQKRLRQIQFFKHRGRIKKVLKLKK